MKSGLKDSVLKPSINPKALIQTSENEEKAALPPYQKEREKK